MKLAALALVSTLAACGNDPYLVVESSDTTLPAAEASPDSWSYNGGSVAVGLPGQTAYPHPLALRFVVEQDQGDDFPAELAVASGTLAVEPGSPCEMSIPPSCGGTSCYAELTVTGMGNCLIRASTTTVQAERFQLCQAFAAFEAEDTSAAIDALSAQVDAEVAHCEDSL